MRRWRAIAAGAAATAAVCSGVLTGAGAAAAGTRAAVPARATSGGTWSTAEEVPGIAALNQGDAHFWALSCASAGSCAGGGYYHDVAGNGQAFVVSEANGVWRRAEEVPGTAALNQGRDAMVLSVSCAAAGYCAAGGFYTDAAGNGQAFVVSERHGTWSRAHEVRGTAQLNPGGLAQVAAVSCASPGYCAAGGAYTDAAGNGQAFVVSERHGTWSRAHEVPGIAALNLGGDAEAGTLSCPSPGNCAAGGYYTGGGLQAFVVSQVHGTWQQAEQVPGTAVLNHGYAAVAQVSCSSAGNCGAGGLYSTPLTYQAYVVSEVNGTWRTAKKVPGSGSLNTGGDASVYSVSCGAPGICAAGGEYRDSARRHQAFVVSERDGAWGAAQQVPGTAALNAGGYAAVNQVSCASPGNCSAGGSYTGQSGHGEAFVAGQADGIWGTAEQVPGIAALTRGGDSGIDVVSCAPAGRCSAAGSFNRAGSKANQLFIVTQT